MPEHMAQVLGSALTKVNRPEPRLHIDEDNVHGQVTVPPYVFVMFLL